MRYCKSSLNGTYDEQDFIFFWGHTPAKGGLITESCLSQWWKCQFMENNIMFCCAEQYMMYKKALLFNDYEYANKIISSCDPKEIKEYGRLIRNFDEMIWNSNKFIIVVRGNILKFSQNEILKEYLLSTNNKILVEASPYDRIWGIGAKRGTEGICEPQKWKGQNLLGFALMETRERVV
jgi:hypothetical protein